MLRMCVRWRTVRRSICRIRCAFAPAAGRRRMGILPASALLRARGGVPAARIGNRTNGGIGFHDAAALLAALLDYDMARCAVDRRDALAVARRSAPAGAVR